MLTQEEVLNIKHERYFRYVFLCLFLSYPISSYISDFLHIQSNILSIATRGIQVITVGLYFVFLLWYKRFKVRLANLLLFVIFWIIYSIRIIYDTLLHGNDLGFPPSQYYLFGITLSFLSTVPLFAVSPINNVKLDRQLLIFSFVLTALAFYSALKNETLFVERAGGNERLNPISTGLIATLCVLISLKNLIFYKKKALVSIIFYFSCVTLGVIMLLVVSTKIMFLSIAIVILLIILNLFSNLKIGSIFGLGVFFAAAFLIVLYGGYADYFELSLTRFTDIQDDQSSQIRVDLINGAVKQFSESPILGSFLEEKVFKFYPHNLLFEALMATGIIGGFFYIVYYLLFSYQTFHAAVKTQFNAVSIIAVCQCLMALTSGSLSFSQEFWEVTAIVSWLAYAPSLNYIQTEDTVIQGQQEGGSKLSIE